MHLPPFRNIGVSTAPSAPPVPTPLVLHLLPTQKLEMINNCCVVNCTNFIGKKKKDSASTSTGSL